MTGRRLKNMIMILLMGVCTQVLAQDPTTPVLTFQNWKEQQILDAQNQVLRISARLSNSKNAKTNAATGKDLNLGNARLKKVESDSLTVIERDLRRAQESLQAATNYGMEEYIQIYLPTISDDKDAVHSLTQRLSKEELAEILKGLLKKESSSDAKCNSTLASDVSAMNTRSKTP